MKFRSIHKRRRSRIYKVVSVIAESLESRICLTGELFTPLGTASSGSGANAFAVGDFNEDFHPDLVITNADVGFVGLPSLATGGFDSPRINTGFGGNALDVVVADLNGDTHVDAAILDSANNRVVVYPGPSTGTFSNPSFFSVGQNPGAMVLGDVNGDTKPDLIVADRGSLTLSVLLAGGTSFFNLTKVTSTAAPVQSMTAGDFNGDGRADVAATMASGELAVFFGNPDGTLAFSAPYLTNANPTDVVAGNFNSDGLLDLAVTIQSQGRVQILLNGGNGIFNNSQSVFLGGLPEDLAIGDLNDDGLADLAVVNPSVSQVQILLGVGGGGFAGPFNFSIGAQPRRILIADFDGDTLDDFAVLVPSSNSVVTFRQNVLPPIGLAPIAVDQTSTAVNNAIIAGFVDVMSGTTAAEYRATINWGDGTADTSGLISLSNGNFFEIRGSHTYSAPGNYQAKILLEHVGGRFVKTQSPIHIGVPQLIAAGIPVLATVNQPFSGPVAAVADQNLASVASDFTAQIDWGDGTAVTNGTVVAIANGFRVDGTHTYTTSNSFPIQITINHRDGRTTQATSAASVGANALVAVGTALQGVVGQPLVNAILGILVDPTNATTAGDFTVSIDWGDGTAATAGTVVAAQTVFNILGSHTYTVQNNFVINLSIVAKDTRTASTVSSIDVQSGTLGVTGLVFSAFAGLPKANVPVALISDSQPNSVASDFTATITWGDGTQSAGVISSQSQGVISVTGTHTYTTAGAFPFTVDVHHTDGRNANGGATANINASNLSAVGDHLQAVVGVPQNSVRVATLLDPVPGTIAANFSAQINWGDGSPIDTVVGFVATGTGSFDVIGSHTYAAIGSFAVQVNILHTDGRNAQASGQADVTGVHAITGTGQSIPGLAGTALTGVTVATFTDAAPGPVGSYSATIDWGDGTAQTNGVIVLQGQGFAVQGNHTYAAAGGFNIAVHIAHSQGASADVVGSAAITGQGLFLAPAGISTSATQPLTNVLVGTINSLKAGSVVGDFTATIDWGDGTNPTQGSIAALGGPLFSVRGDHTYPTAGGFTFTVSVHRLDGANTQGQGVAQVSATGLSATGVGIQTRERVPLTGVLVATVTDSHSGTTAADFTATIDWGDGTTPSSGTVVAGTQGRFDVRGDHIYALAGNYSLAITIQHTDGRSTSTGATAVIDVARLVVIPRQGLTATINAPLSDVTIAVITDPVTATTAGELTATIDWGDGTSAAAGTVVVNPSGGFFLRGTHTYTSAANFQTHITVLHIDGRSASADVAIAVSAFSLNADGINVPAIAGLRTAPVRVAVFTDDAPNVTAADYTAVIDWGDGHTSPGLIVQRPDGSFAVRGRNTFRHAGGFSVEVQIRHTDGRSASTKSHARVFNGARVSRSPAIVLTAGKSLHGRVFSFIDPNPLSLESDYLATIDWGDGSSSAAGVVRKTGLRFDIFANHIYVPGKYTLQVHISDVFGGQFDANVDVTAQ